MSLIKLLKELKVKHQRQHHRQKKKDLSKGLTSIVDQIPQSYREQSKRLLTYLAKK
jgi:hypothetical protein